jgi:hypothetical protein
VNGHDHDDQSKTAVLTNPFLLESVFLTFALQMATICVPLLNPNLSYHAVDPASSRPLPPPFNRGIFCCRTRKMVQTPGLIVPQIINQISSPF